MVDRVLMTLVDPEDSTLKALFIVQVPWFAENANHNIEDYWTVNESQINTLIRWNSGATSGWLNKRWRNVNLDITGSNGYLNVAKIMNFSSPNNLDQSEGTVFIHKNAHTKGLSSEGSDWRKCRWSMR